MSEDKILNFDLMKNNGDTAPLNPDAVLKVLQQIPNDIIFEYDVETKKYLDEKILFSTILISIDNPNICRRHIEKLSPDQLNKFCKLIIYLASGDMMDKIPEILLHGVNLFVPSPEQRENSYTLLKQIKEANIPHRKVAKISSHLQKLETILWFTEKIKINDLEAVGDEFLSDQICFFDEADIDFITEYLKTCFTDESK